MRFVCLCIIKWEHVVFSPFDRSVCLQVLVVVPCFCLYDSPICLLIFTIVCVRLFSSVPFDWARRTVSFLSINFWPLFRSHSSSLCVWMYACNNVDRIYNIFTNYCVNISSVADFLCIHMGFCCAPLWQIHICTHTLSLSLIRLCVVQRVGTSLIQKHIQAVHLRLYSCSAHTRTHLSPITKLGSWTHWAHCVHAKAAPSISLSSALSTFIVLHWLCTVATLCAGIVIARSICSV